MALKSTADIIREAGGQVVFLERHLAWEVRRQTAPRHASVEEICRIEPRLETLYRSIPALMRYGPWDIAWSNLKCRFSRMVGWEAEKAELASSSDYDLIFQHFLAEAERYE